MMKRITTHVLDTARGKPARDVPVRLERQEKSGDWVPLGSARTDHDGRCGQLLPDDKVLSAGLYRLAFDTGKLFRGARRSRVYIRWWKSHFWCGMAKRTSIFRCC